MSNLSQINNKRDVEAINAKTRELLGVSAGELKRLLLTKTHSELRTGLDICDIVCIKKLNEDKGILNK